MHCGHEGEGSILVKVGLDWGNISEVDKTVFVHRGAY